MQQPELTRSIAITGSNGFIGSNLKYWIADKYKKVNLYEVNRETSERKLIEIIRNVDVIVHCAGTNRSDDESEFIEGNVTYIKNIVTYCKAASVAPRVILLSSIHSNRDDVYGITKASCEEIVNQYRADYCQSSTILKLPGIFGKWSRPNYNSVVATFCNNVAKGLELSINDNSKEIDLLYIDDLANTICNLIFNVEESEEINKNIFRVRIKWLANYISGLHAGRKMLSVPSFSNALEKNLYSTYLSFLEKSQFEYNIGSKHDSRGWFIELFKSTYSGQVSALSLNPGITRGGHHHHTKIEKFIVLAGNVIFNLYNIKTLERVSIESIDEVSKIVEIPPGWSHEITNRSNEVALLVVWANEIYDGQRPDTHIS
jgi:UDP-2-acetamido-2,6-beta-L-arabino-hexul-4-ose reductase